MVGLPVPTSNPPSLFVATTFIAFLLPSAIAFNAAAELQRCLTPTEIFQRVCPRLEESNRFIARLVLVRLNKQLIFEQNINQTSLPRRVDYRKPLVRTVKSLLKDEPVEMLDLDVLVDGIKACASIARVIFPIDPVTSHEIGRIVVNSMREFDGLERKELSHHHRTGFQWAVDCFTAMDESLVIPQAITALWKTSDTPFRIHPGLLDDIPSLDDLYAEVDFHRDEIRTSSTQKVVRERRLTAWQGDEGVASFLYSGKAMSRQGWTPLVRSVHDQLCQLMGIYYDCCLINYYPGDRLSGMRYHRDPDQGVLWSFDTAVVSVGATRRFAFRASNNSSENHNFVVSHGDVTHMFGDCQKRFEHTVKKAEVRADTSSRISLVFKQTFIPEHRSS